MVEVGVSSDDRDDGQRLGREGFGDVGGITSRVYDDCFARDIITDDIAVTSKWSHHFVVEQSRGQDGSPAPRARPRKRGKRSPSFQPTTPIAAVQPQANTAVGKGSGAA
jgi:hypothetical protein